MNRTQDPALCDHLRSAELTNIASLLFFIRLKKMKCRLEILRFKRFGEGSKISCKLVPCIAYNCFAAVTQQASLFKSEAMNLKQ